MASVNTKQFFYTTNITSSHSQLLPSRFVPRSFAFVAQDRNRWFGGFYLSTHRNRRAVAEASTEKGNNSLADDDEDGVLLGTMKLPMNIDLPRFETLLFQWANSLCQGANLPLPVPLKVDKIPGGARLGFITVGDGETEVLVHIDCLVFWATDGSSPIFRAIRNGHKKNQPPPGEPRIMRSLMQALQKSVQIARL